MEKADKLYLGNIITMDERTPRAEALTVKDGKFQYVGSEEIARMLCDESTEIIDCGSNTIYPGFLEAHCHVLGAGRTLDPDALADLSPGKSNADCVEIIRQFIEKHPGRDKYSAHSFMEHETYPTAAMLDAVCSEVPIVVNSIDGHSMWLNSKAMEVFEINRNTVAAYGTEMVHVDADGNPIGYLSETPAFIIMSKNTLTPEEAISFLKTAEKFFFSMGYTAVYDAGIELLDNRCADFYIGAIEAGYKLRTYGGSLIDEYCKDITGAVQNITKLRKKYNCEYFKILGVKTFTDGVIEAHTGLLLEDYYDAAGYKGVSRMTDHDKLVELYTAAAENDMNVHAHTIGDGAVRCHLDAIEEATSKTGKTDQRYALAHLQVVSEDDFKRFAELNVVTVTAPLWTEKHPVYFPQECSFLGTERAEKAYPIRSLVEAGAVNVFHTDFPVSPVIGIPLSIYMAVTRRAPGNDTSFARNPAESISRYDALCSMTTNVAYMWREESRLGSIASGKIANLSVFDKDFLTVDLEEIPKAQLIYTVIDGDIVYSA